MIAEATAWGAGSHHRMDDYVEMTYLCLGDILK